MCTRSQNAAATWGVPTSQGIPSKDADLPTELEAKLFCYTGTKLLWIILQPFFYALRPVLVYPKPVTGLEVVNFLVQLAFDVLVYKFCGEPTPQMTPLLDLRSVLRRARRRKERVCCFAASLNELPCVCRSRRVGDTPTTTSRSRFETAIYPSGHDIGQRQVHAFAFECARVRCVSFQPPNCRHAAVIYLAALEHIRPTYTLL